VQFPPPPLGLDDCTVRFWNPYWGGDAAHFAWGYASLPGRLEEKFGPADEVPALILGQVWEGEEAAMECGYSCRRASR
jgi:hypothetical protein